MNQFVDLSHAEAFVDGFPFDFFAELRALDGLYWHEATHLTPDGEGFWVASRYRDVVTVLGDAARFSSAGNAIRSRGGTSIADTEVIAENITTSEGARHKRIRARIEQSVTEGWLPTHRAMARQRARDALAGAMRLDSFDFVHMVGRELGSHIVFDMLGVPEADRQQIIDWTLSDPNGELSVEGRTMREAYFRELISRQPTGEASVLSAVRAPPR